MVGVTCGDTVENVVADVDLTVLSFAVTLRYHWMIDPVGNVFAGTLMLLVDVLLVIWLYVEAPCTRQYRTADFCVTAPCVLLSVHAKEVAVFVATPDPLGAVVIVSV